MKLAAGNPNLMKVNKPTGLGSFAFTTGDKAHIKERTGFRPSVKPPDAVPAPRMSLWERGIYEPPKNEYVRPGANDFLNIKGRGF
jgi:hypothetical protein